MNTLKHKLSKYIGAALVSCAIILPVSAHAVDVQNEYTNYSESIAKLIPVAVENTHTFLTRALPTITAWGVPTHLPVAAIAAAYSPPKAELDLTMTGALPPSIFKSVALPIRNLAVAARWQPAYAKLGQSLGADCAAADCHARSDMLDEAVRQARDARFLHRLQIINKAVNTSIKYATDRDIYKRVDHWATPAQTVMAGRGDCEDYAILKMAALKAAGIPESSMTLVVLRDRKRDLFHAVLAVTTDQGHFILDNVHDKVLLDTDIGRYQPLFSMSRDRYWLHGTRRSSDPLMASNTASWRNIAPGEGPGTLLSSGTF